jgi:hypothetical protein
VCDLAGAPVHTWTPLSYAHGILLPDLAVQAYQSLRAVRTCCCQASLHAPLHLPSDPTGGPGFESPRPTEANGWIKTALNSFRVVLMDQRGTGRSSQITVKNLAKFKDAKEQAEYLSYFRWGHATVPAAPHHRHEQLLSHTSVLGRSHSGMCTCSR